MAQRLRALAALPADLGLDQSTHVRQLTTSCISIVSGSDALFWFPWAPVHAWQADTHKIKVNVNLINDNSKNDKANSCFMH